MHKIYIVARIALVFTLALPLSAFASGFYTSGSTGYDIAQNTSIPYPIPHGFGIVNVTDGRAYGTNANLQGEYAWAQGGTSATPSLYMNLNAAIGSTAKGNTSAPNSCKKNDKVCQGYNYGYNAAASAYSYAQSVGVSSSMWWLDIETANSWSSSTAVNDSTIQGAIAYLTAQPGTQVGIYSIPSMWKKIAGSWSVGAPEWLAIGSASQTQAVTACSNASFTGGPLWLVQYENSNSTADQDYSC